MNNIFGWSGNMYDNPVYMVNPLLYYLCILIVFILFLLGMVEFWNFWIPGLKKKLVSVLIFITDDERG